MARLTNANKSQWGTIPSLLSPRLPYKKVNERTWCSNDWRSSQLTDLLFLLALLAPWPVNQLNSVVQWGEDTRRREFIGAFLRLFTITLQERGLGCKCKTVFTQLRSFELLLKTPSWNVFYVTCMWRVYVTVALMVSIWVTRCLKIIL